MYRIKSLKCKEAGRLEGILAGYGEGETTRMTYK